MPLEGRLSIWDVCYQTPQAVLKRNRKKTNRDSLPCSQPGFTEPAPLDAAGALLPHLCTLTNQFWILNFRLWIQSKIHNPKSKIGGGIFLWHYPHGRPHWALPSKFGLSGARTFLRLARTANLQPPAPTLSRSSVWHIQEP